MGVIHGLYRVLAWTWGGAPFTSPVAGYNILSGDVADLSLLAAVVLFVRHHNCHVRGCWHFGHIDPEHGHPACRTHHSKTDVLGVDPHC